MNTPRQLDPAKRVTRFDAEHVALVDAPGNGRKFLLIQDDSSTELADAVTTLSSLLGPLVGFMVKEVQEAMRCCMDYAAPKKADNDVMLAFYPALDDAQKRAMEEAFTFSYPDPATIAGIAVGLGAVSESAANGCYEAAQTLLGVTRAYTPESWALSDDVIVTTTDHARSLVEAAVLEAVRSDKLPNAEHAALIRSLEPGQGCLVTKDSPLLWRLFDPTATDDVAVAEESAPAPVEAAAAPATPEPISQPVSETQAAPAVNSIRRMMQLADPVVAELDGQAAEVKSVAQGALGGTPTVNQSASDTDVPVTDPIVQRMLEARKALATPGLTELERAGVLRHYLTEIERDLAATATPPATADMATAAATNDALAQIQEALVAISSRLDGVERSMDGAAVTAPSRRSFQPRSMATQNDDGGNTYRPRSARELAQVNTTY